MMSGFEAEPSAKAWSATGPVRSELVSVARDHGSVGCERRGLAKTLERELIEHIAGAYEQDAGRAAPRERRLEVALDQRGGLGAAGRQRRARVRDRVFLTRLDPHGQRGGRGRRVAQHRDPGEPVHARRRREHGLDGGEILSPPVDRIAMRAQPSPCRERRALGYA